MESCKVFVYGLDRGTGLGVRRVAGLDADRARQLLLVQSFVVVAECGGVPGLKCDGMGDVRRGQVFGIWSKTGA